jgi:hypothetical protein
LFIAGNLSFSEEKFLPKRRLINEENKSEEIIKKLSEYRQPKSGVEKEEVKKY